ncbi:MAG TPA: PhoPQ-activated pathogenicity-related family protein [Planctomycetaceae bacterium]|jgi:PhoPQ-activated pathogenicity-related protein|nr:PhoPQ-activated pathogenicity-related family protein [Planctomycetaceae bacterium]
MPRSISVDFRRVSAALLAVALSCLPQLRAGETALDRYVAKPDKTYSWKVISKTQVPGATVFVVDLKSQTWRTPKDVDRPVWQHWLTIVKPDKPAGNIPFLFITGGSNDGKPPAKVDGLIVMTAKHSGGIVCELKMVPNEPLVFKNDGKKRKEDDLIAYTWNEFLQGGDDEWPARLPMVKSAARAMDCIQELLASDEGGNFKVDKFVVAGGSKRGWTTWCTAAVDKRVAAIVPSSIDCLNNGPSMAHHVAVYGFYTLAVGDYVRHNIVRQTANPRMKLLHEIEDPYSYRERLTMPKYIVNAAGDQYFCPDNSQFYFDALPGEKYLRYVPNADHGLKGSDARESVATFYHMVLTGQERPTYSWTFEQDGSIRVKTSSHPKSVTLWQANNPEARDFRLMTIGKAYKPTVLTDEGGGVYVAKIEKPERGWTASFVELAFDVGAPNAFKISTAVRVTPDTLPHADIDPTKAPAEKPRHRERLRASVN